MQIGTLLVEEALHPGAIQATGNAGRHAVPCGVYPCAGDDEWCAVSIRDEFLSVAAHELKTPMTSLRGYAQLLAREFESGRAELASPERARRTVVDA